jgi:hypothetical protein
VSIPGVHAIPLDGVLELHSNPVYVAQRNLSTDYLLRTQTDFGTYLIGTPGIDSLERAA